MRAFQVHLVSTGLSWPALNQTVCALRLFFGVTLGYDEIPERFAYPRRHPSCRRYVNMFAEAISKPLDGKGGIFWTAATSSIWLVLYGIQDVITYFQCLGVN